MLIQDAISRINSSPDSWVRIEQIRKIPQGLELCICIHRGKRGRRAEAWRVRCLGIREFHIADMDGGGLAIYPSTHPAARQYMARQVELRWSGGEDYSTVLGALYQAHMDAVDDWIPIDRYIDIRRISVHKATCRGPDFLMRAYARALRRLGLQPKLAVRKNRKKRKIVGPRVLHFGDSSIVATFTLELEGTSMTCPA